MNHKGITLAYHEKWLGEDGCLSSPFGINFIYSDHRNVCQAGYPHQFDLMVWLDSDRLIVSYGDKTAGKIELLRDVVGARGDVSGLAEGIAQVYSHRPAHEIKFMFKELAPKPNITVKILSMEDYKDYEAFYLACYPGSDVGWLGEYFSKIAAKGYCCGVYVDGALISCTDGPDMPYMSDFIQHIGINTVEGYQGKGYATAACIAALDNVLAQNKVPEWSCPIANIPSQKLAERVGFAKLADVLTLTLQA